jgi:ubiquinone/menaquinone biosynthesis C-methylase UbiE
LQAFFNTHKPKSTPRIVEIALAQTPSTSGVAIDLCCGTGQLVQSLRERGWRAYGVDISDAFIGQDTPQRTGFAVANVEQTPFADGCADVVYCIDSLQYFQQPEAMLREMGRLLKPNGVVIFSTQNNYNPTGIKRAIIERITGKTWSPWLAHPIENHITYPWLMVELGRQGYRVEYVRGQQFLTAWVSVLPRVVRHWTPQKSKPWRTLAGVAQRTRLPKRLEESFLARFAMMVFIRARKG